MSYRFEVILFQADGPSALDAFKATISPLHLRLVDLQDGLFGIRRIPANHDPDNSDLLLEAVAKGVSMRFGSAVLLIYNDRYDVSTSMGVLYEDGSPTRGFGEEDERWLSLGEDGQLDTSGPYLCPSQFLSGIEYGCIFSATDACLMAIHARPLCDEDELIRAFGDEE